MSTPWQIACYFNAFANVAEYEIIVQILSGVHRYVRAGRSLTLGPLPQQALLTTVQSVESWAGDAIIGLFYERELVEATLARGISVINLTQHLSAMKIPVVVSDNHAIGRMAAQHLLERGCRQFGYFSLADFPFSVQRREGFLDELRAQRIADTAIWKKIRYTREITPEWFAAECGHIELPVGIFAADDDLAVRVLVAAQANGINVPQNCAIIGVNDLDMICETAAVPLTSIAPAYVRIGIEAARIADEFLQKKLPADHVSRVPPLGLNARMSTRFFAFEDPLVEQALVYIHANISQPFNVEDVVRHCDKSRRTLEKRFTTAVGRSLHEEINRLRLARAKQLLADTDWTIEQIAERCGFSASKRLYEAFMRTEGTTPKVYRNA